MIEEMMFPSSGGLLLEGVLTVPEGKGPFPGVAVCHPHPLYGGSMDNNVVDAVCAALRGHSIASLKFNFRGVGGSQGSYSGGVGEGEDVAAAISFLAGSSGIDRERIGLAGYSAGAGFGIPVAVADERIKALAAISAPLSMYDLAGLQNCPKPKLMVSGEMDTFIPPEQFDKFCESLAQPCCCHTFAGADHFWWDCEGEMAEMVAGFFAGAFSGER